MTDLQEQANEVIKKIEEATETPTPPSTGGDESTNEAGVESIGFNPMLDARIVRVQNTTGDRAASDFPDPMECQRLYSIALMISKAADPGLTEDSQPITPIMPPKLATGNWPKLMAWAAAITELAAGGLLILGLLTRLSALGTLSVMLVAMWMTQFGHAAFHTNDAILGFIPRADDLFSPAAGACVDVAGGGLPGQRGHRAGSADFLIASPGPVSARRPEGGQEAGDEPRLGPTHRV